MVALVQKFVDDKLSISELLGYAPLTESPTYTEDFVRMVLNEVENTKSNFLNIKSERITKTSTGYIGVYTGKNLIEGSEYTKSDSPHKLYKSPIEHVAGFRLARYLNINNKDSVEIGKRGFISWDYVAKNQLIFDPEIINLQDNDRIYLAFDQEGRILAHLQVSNLPHEYGALSMSPEGRGEDQKLHLEEIFGSTWINQDPKISNLLMKQVRIFGRYSRVSHQPGNDRLNPLGNKIFKARLITQLTTTVFSDLIELRRQEDIQALIFDGEETATKSINLLGLDVNTFPEITPKHVPAYLEPRYRFNNKGNVYPQVVHLDQLDSQDFLELQNNLIENKSNTMVSLILKKLLMDLTKHTMQLIF